MAVTAERLNEIWETPAGFVSGLFSVDHKEIGRRYLITAFAFFLVGGIEALWMRLQIAQPGETLVGPHTYDQLFTTHGVTMLFLFATPIIIGSFGNFMIPLQLGARDMAFPRLNAFSYWSFLFGGLFIYGSLLVGSPPNDGWFAYVPLSSQTYTPGPNQDFWSLGLLFLTVSSTVSAINFTVTVFKLRCPGLSINRLSLFIWSEIVTALMIIFSFPSLTVAIIFTELERKWGFHFFDPSGGGNPILWQHLFWFFGHPIVYIWFVPATGVISSVVPVFSQRRMIGYTFIALASVSVGFLSFGVYVHHMFTVGLPMLALAFFSAASMMVSFPSIVQVFCWMATIFHGRVRWQTPFLYVLGYIFVFVIGGISGVMTGSVPLDWQVHNTYFVIAHIHYVVAGTVVFGLLAGLYYWVPKMWGRMMGEVLGPLGFWTIFVGFNLAFFPMHIVGLEGMPRQWYTYPAGLGWGPWNLLETFGAFIMAFGVLVVIVDFFKTLHSGPPAPDNPWQADTLEWAVSSPPPAYNFLSIPVVRSREPLWDQPELAAINRPAPEPRGPALAPPSMTRETVTTSVFDAEAAEIVHMPEDSYWPLALAFGILVFLIGFLPSLQITQILVIAIGVVIIGVSILGWFWPGSMEHAP
ncbi:MAG TPA: cbb3-type cytochrome c oxidase subunit I [Dehalococcoidia bacterium]|nr:cbb3-type cytochrome c oxidase subunit I [Dehalococcoidia bacterium]